MGKTEMKRRRVKVDEREVMSLATNLKAELTIRGTTRLKTDAERRCEARRKLTQRMSREFAPRYSLYALRHTWATNALRKGVDSLTVAILMGHKDPSTLARVYQHLSLNPGHLLTEARRASV
jgi:integrase